MVNLYYVVTSELDLNKDYSHFSLAYVDQELEELKYRVGF